MCYCETNMQTECAHECEAEDVKNLSVAKSMNRKVSLNSRADIIEYCKSIINTQFYGETESNETSRRTTRKSSLFTVFNAEKMRKFTEEELIIQIKKPSLTLGHLLRDLYNSLQKCNDSANEKPSNDVIEILRHIAESRKQAGESTFDCFERLKNQWPVFVEKLQKTDLKSLRVDVSSKHWGSRSQLRAGKVVSDHVTEEDLDPIFGVLLCPAAGEMENKDAYCHSQTPSTEFRYSNSCERNNQPITYHNIMQDAFRYLKEAHDIGPGENYLDDYSLFHSEHISGNLLALIFWERLINRIIEEDLAIEVKII